MATPRITSSKTKKTTIPPKPNAGKQTSLKTLAQIDQFVAGGPVEEILDSSAVVVEAASTELSEANQKGKMKRLTLDISEDLHKAIKMQSVTLGIPMVDMLRKLLESNYGKP